MSENIYRFSRFQEFFRLLLTKQIKDKYEDLIVRRSGFATKQLIYLLWVFMPSGINIVTDSIVN